MRVLQRPHDCTQCFDIVHHGLRYPGNNGRGGVVAHTDTMRSPFRSSPHRSAGPPARMKEMKMPSPSSPPTMLKPSPVVPRCSTTFRGSLRTRGWCASVTRLLTTRPSNPQYHITATHKHTTNNKNITTDPLFNDNKDSVPLSAHTIILFKLLE